MIQSDISISLLSNKTLKLFLVRPTASWKDVLKGALDLFSLPMVDYPRYQILDSDKKEVHSLNQISETQIYYLKEVITDPFKQNIQPQNQFDIMEAEELSNSFHNLEISNSKPETEYLDNDLIAPEISFDAFENKFIAGDRKNLTDQLYKWANNLKFDLKIMGGRQNFANAIQKAKYVCKQPSCKFKMCFINKNEEGFHLDTTPSISSHNHELKVQNTARGKWASEIIKSMMELMGKLSVDTLTKYINGRYNTTFRNK